MKIRKNFNQLKWINNYLGINIKRKNIKSILMFTIYWNVLEHEVCDDNFNIQRIKNIINSRNLDKSNFILYFEYFRQRYTNDNGNINDIFDGLRFRKNADKQFVQECLTRNNNNSEEIISSLFLVIQRLRNNIFHGLKDPATFENQEPNFNIANKAIATFLNLYKKIM